MTYRHTNCAPNCGICASVDYSRRRHVHPDSVTCVEAGIAGHPPRRCGVCYGVGWTTCVDGPRITCFRCAGTGVEPDAA
jgi:hypothetical protein